MILQALNDYYIRKAADPQTGLGTGRLRVEGDSFCAGTR